MRNMTTAFAAALAMLALASCAKKEEAPAAPAAEQAAPMEAAPAAPPPAEAAPTETPPADAAPPADDANSEDAEQSGGDKVKP
jgi:hypothetical protein